MTPEEFAALIDKYTPGIAEVADGRVFIVAQNADEGVFLTEAGAELRNRQLESATGDEPPAAELIPPEGAADGKWAAKDRIGDRKKDKALYSSEASRARGDEWHDRLDELGPLTGEQKSVGRTSELWRQSECSPSRACCPAWRRSGLGRRRAAATKSPMFSAALWTLIGKIRIVDGAANVLIVEGAPIGTGPLEKPTFAVIARPRGGEETASFREFDTLQEAAREAIRTINNSDPDMINRILKREEAQARYMGCVAGGGN